MRRRPMPDATVGIKEFAELYGCTVRHAQKLVRDGKAPRNFKTGRYIRFFTSDVEAWFKTREMRNPENK